MNLILFGAPGSGKGTQSLMLSERLGLKRISLGDILRKEVKEDSSLGRKVKAYMDKGVLVPDALVVQVIEHYLHSDGFILDGYPRNLAQAKKLEEILKKHNISIDSFVYLDVDQQTIIDRLTQRIVCKICGANYHLKNMPPKKNGICDSCRGVLSQRKDDTREIILKRWEVFCKESAPLIDFYKKQNRLVVVDGSSDKDAIFEKIKIEAR